MLVAIAECMLHVEQVARVGTQVILNALLVADINEKTSEDTGLAAFVHGDKQTALQHILQKTCSFETHRLTTGIRARDEQYAAVAIEFNVECRHLAAMLAQ